MPIEQSTPSQSVAEIRVGLLEYLAARLPEETGLDIDTDLLTEELLDSLLIMDLVAHIEAEQGVKLANSDIAPRHFRTVRALAALVAERHYRAD